MNQNLRIVVWGLGTNGKNLIDILGIENIIAIIDSNQDKQSIGFYQNIPIISFDTYLKKYYSELIVITPMKYRDIEEMLIKYRVKGYFILVNSRIRLAAFLLLKTGQFIKQFRINKDKIYYISGMDLFSICLYKYLVENEIKTILMYNNVKQKYIYDILNKKNIIDGYISKIEDLKDAVIIRTDDEVLGEWRDLEIIDYEYINKITYQSWKEDLRKFQNCHIGERAFIIATGPSIRIEDLEKLRRLHELTISMNGIIYLLDKTTWRPDYYVVSDGHMLRLYEEELEGKQYLKKTEKLFSDNYLKFWESEHDSTYYCFHQMQNPYEIKFSEDCSEKVYAGYTVVYACIQLAVYMGIKEIYLMGCDFSFSSDMSEAVNHCYNRKSLFFYKFDFERVLSGYMCAKRYADEHGIKIYNATRGGKLEIFDRVDFESLF